MKPVQKLLLFHILYGAQSRSLVERLTGGRKVASLSPTAGEITVECPLEKHFISYLALVQPRKTRPDMTEKSIDLDAKN